MLAVASVIAAIVVDGDDDNGLGVGQGTTTTTQTTPTTASTSTTTPDGAGAGNGMTSDGTGEMAGPGVIAETGGESLLLPAGLALATAVLLRRNLRQ